MALSGSVRASGSGAGIGALGGGLLAALLYWRPVVPEGLHNVLGLGFAVAIFQIANSLLDESGITAAIVAGLVVGNLRVQSLHELVEFKEQLVAFFIATLFVLLSADVRMADVLALGWQGVVTVVLLMIVVRPLTVWASTRKSQLSVRQKAFLSWLAPRGIVAAAVASLFATELAAEGIDGGLKVRALVFLVIAMTVTIQGLSGGPIAGLLGVRRPPKTGYAILGANVVGRHLGSLIKQAGHEVVFIDANPDLARATEEAGFRVVYGNGLEERTLLRARLDHRAGAIAVTENESVNFVFARKVHDLFPKMTIHVALETGESGVTVKAVEGLGAEVLFGRARRVGLWRQRMNARHATVERWKFANPAPHFELEHAPGSTLLPLGGLRDDKFLFVDRHLVLRQDDILEFAFYPEKVEAGRKWLRAAGWRRLEDDSTDADDGATDDGTAGAVTDPPAEPQG